MSHFRQKATATHSDTGRPRSDLAVGTGSGVVWRRRSGGDDGQRAVVGFEGGGHVLGVALACARDRLAALGHEPDALLRCGGDSGIAGIISRAKRTDFHDLRRLSCNEYIQ